MKESRKEKGVLGRLFQHMGMFKITMVIAIILSAVSSVINLYAFVCVYNVAKEIVQSLGNIHSLDQTYMVDMGWRAVLLILTSFGLYGMALLFSHITAFNTVAKLRIQIVRHIGNLPLGYHTTNPSGKQRKIIEKNSDNLETLIAHQIPDFAGAVALPVAFLVFMFVYDWRLSLICLIPILVGFGILYYMLKDESEGFAKQYQKSAEDISNAVTAYIRGIAVVKVFRQTANSFQRYKAAVCLTVSCVMISSDSFGIMNVVLPCLAAIPLLFLILLKKPHIAAYYAVMYLITATVPRLLMPHVSPLFNLLFTGMIAMFTKLIPGMSMFCLLVLTTTVSEFVAAMDRLHISKKFSVPVSVMFHFLPTIREEYRAIRDAMRLREVGSWRNPMEMLEYRMVPLLTGLVTIGNELSTSALTRGLDAPVRRTNVCPIGFHWQDSVALLLCIVVITCFVLSTFYGW